MSATVSTGGTYILSYWIKGSNPNTNVSRSLVQTSAPDANGFVYHEYEVDLNVGGTIALTGSNYGVSLDEVRLYPGDARISTICYGEHLQIHTMTDINNYSTYYQYDAFQRLISVMDKDSNLLQTQDYHYKR